jgi:hypothetical protein
MSGCLFRIPLDKGIFVLFLIQKRVINDPDFGINNAVVWQVLKTMGGWHSPLTGLNSFLEF